MRIGCVTELVTLTAALTLLAACAGTASATWPPAASAPAGSAFEADRRAILAMAGDYDVTFSFRETVVLTPGYTLKPEKKTGGHEVVRVIRDDGRFISLQHILVAEGDHKMAIKHWRQDWVYEPTEIFAFTGHNSFKRRAVSPAERKGAWAQLVYQVDDSPRYAGVARWAHESGISSWTSPATWRPLPRREATTRSDYHVLLGFNRHVITPNGWVHEQENSKLVLGSPQHILAREIGVNTYTRSSGFDASIATSYWAKTRGFWALVSDSWQSIGKAHDQYGITLEGETEKLYMPILALADEVAAGKKQAEAAAAEARAIMLDYLKVGARVPPNKGGA